MWRVRGSFLSWLWQKLSGHWRRRASTRMCLETSSHRAPHHLLQKFTRRASLAAAKTRARVSCARNTSRVIMSTMVVRENIQRGGVYRATMRMSHRAWPRRVTGRCKRSTNAWCGTTLASSCSSPQNIKNLSRRSVARPWTRQALPRRHAGLLAVQRKKLRPPEIARSLFRERATLRVRAARLGADLASSSSEQELQVEVLRVSRLLDTAAEASVGGSQVRGC